MGNHLRRAFTLWIPLVVALTGVLGFAFVATQQNYRMSAEDPQIQMAEDAAVVLSRDNTPSKVVPHGSPLIDIRTSLATWVTVYDASGTPLESTALLDNAPPKLPQGLFDSATWVEHKKWKAPTGDETRVTWQPREGVRQAVVLVSFDSPSGKGYVAVGRSMRSIEERIMNLYEFAAIAWSVTVVATLAAIFILLALGRV